MKVLRADERVTVRLSSEARARFRALARAYGLTESALLNRLISGAINILPPPTGEALYKVEDAARAERLSVRLYPDDRQLLAERASARGMASATYLSALARSHLRQLAPLPDVERRAFERCVAELSAIGRNLHQVARRANQEGVISSLTRQDIAVFIKACTAAVDHIKATLMANKASWACGYETSDR